MRPKLAACVDAIDGGVSARAHRRRAHPALAAAGAVHRRGDRHEGQAGRMRLADLQAIEARARDPHLRAHARWSSCAARARGCGTRTATSTSTSCPASRWRTSATATRRSWRRCASRRDGSRTSTNLFYTEPAMRLAQRLATELARRQGLLLQLRRGGERGGDQARAQGARRAGEIVVVHGAFHGRTYGALSATPQEAKQAPFAPLVPGFVVVAPEPARCARRLCDEDTAAVLLEPIQGETGVHVALRGAADRRARRLRPRRRGARSSTRSRRAWAAPARCGRTSRRASCPTR